MAKSWPRNCGIGLKTGKPGGGVLGLDIDVYHRPVVADLWRHIRSNHPHIVGRIGQAPKILIPFCCDEITEKIVSSRWRDPAGNVNAIEILAAGQQFVAFGIHPGTKKPYYWTGNFIEHAMPQITLEEITALFSLLDEQATVRGWTNLSERETKARAEYKPRNNTGDSPGDLYNQATSVTECLLEYGWKHFHGRFWTRPGKQTGVSASVFDDSAVYVWTISTSLEPNRTYDCFGLLAHYEYNGDFSAAAKAISKAMREAA
jgi:hypothetical protein